MFLSMCNGCDYHANWWAPSEPWRRTGRKARKAILISTWKWNFIMQESLQSCRVTERLAKLVFLFPECFCAQVLCTHSSPCGASWEFGSGTATTSWPLDEIPLFLGYRTADAEIDFFEPRTRALWGSQCQCWASTCSGIRFVVRVCTCDLRAPSGGL